MEYGLAFDSNSMRDGIKHGIPAVAKDTIAYRCSKGISLSEALCGGFEATTK
jgi:hypothetical protein